MKNLVWESLAKEQLLSIFNFNKELFSVYVATEVMQVIKNLAALLKQNPYLGIKEVEVGDGKYRYLYFSW